MKFNQQCSGLASAMNLKTSSKLVISSAALLSALLIDGGPARALIASNSAIFRPVLQVDGTTGATELSISGLTSGISNLLVTIDLTKCGITIEPDGACNATPRDFSYNSEIFLNLAAPDGTNANLVISGQLSGQSQGATVTWNFADMFSGPVSGSSLSSGNYQPFDSFSTFNGQDGNGSWILTFADTSPVVSGGDPLSINSWYLEVTDSASPPGPSSVPGPLPVLGIAAAFVWSRCLKRRFKLSHKSREDS